MQKAKKKKRKKPNMGSHLRLHNGWPCILLLAFEDVQTQMMDFTMQTVKCHILRQQGLPLQTNIMTQGGMGLARGGHHIHYRFIGLHYSTAPCGQRIEQHYPPPQGLAPALGPPNQGGRRSNPSVLEAGREPSSNPFPPMFLQFKVLFGRNNSSSKSLKQRFFLG